MVRKGEVKKWWCQLAYLRVVRVDADGGVFCFRDGMDQAANEHCTPNQTIMFVCE